MSGESLKRILWQISFKSSMIVLRELYDTFNKNKFLTETNKNLSAVRVVEVLLGAST